MEGEQSPKQFRTLSKNLQCTVLEPWSPVKREHQPCHQQRTQSQSIVNVLIRTQIPCFDASGKRYCLAERQSKTFSSNRIHRACRIADERDVATPNAF
jgi:hypothetical protein